MKNLNHFRSSPIRLVSALLTIALLCSLLPCGTLFPVAEAEGESNVKAEYNLCLGAYPGDSGIDGRTYTSYTEARQWAYVSDTFTSSGGSLGTPVALTTNFLQLFSARYERLVLKINVPAAGRYKANLSYYGRNAAGIIDIYLIPKTDDSVANTANYMTSEYKLDSMDAYQATAGMNAQDLNDAVFESAGEYLLVLTSTEKNASGTNYYMYPAKLTLDGRTLQSALITLDKSEIDIGETAAASASGTMSDNSAATGVTITYESSNPNVATVDTSSGVITGVASGNTNITATVTKDGISKTATASITVKLPALSGAVVTYDFRLNAYPGDSGIDGRTYTSYTEARPWAYVSDTFTSSGGSLGTPVALTTNFLQLFSARYERLVLKINIPAAGRYKANMSYYGRNAAGIIDIYLIPKTDDAVANTANYMTSEYKLDSMDAYQPTAGMNEQNINDAIFSSAGEYLLVLTSATKNASGTNYFMYPAKLTLDGRTLQSVSLSLGEETLGIGESTTSTVTGLLTGDVPADLNAATVSYTSGNSSVATVDATGKITTVSEGDADITVSVTLNDVTETATKTIHVSDAITLQSITLSGVDTLTTLSMEQLFLCGNQKNGVSFNIPINPDTLTITESNPTGAVELLSGGIAAGRIAGSASIKASVICRGKQFESNSLNFTVRDSVQSSSIARYVFALEGNYDVRNMKNYAEGNKWAYFSDNLTAAGTPITQCDTCIQILSQPGEWAAFKVQVPEEGNYRATLTHLGITGGGIMNLYLLPLTEQTSANIGGYLTDAYLIDQIDGYNSSSSTLSKELDDVYIPAAGEYLLVFKSISNSASSWAAYMYPDTLLLEGERALKSVSVSVNNTEIAVASTAQAGCTATGVDGAGVSLTGATIAFRSSDTQITLESLITIYLPFQILTLKII